MPMNLTNNAVSLLASSTLGAAATSFSITSGDEHRFPSADPGSSTVAATWFPVTLIDTVGNREIMKCTKRVGVILTVVRGQEGTAPRIFPVNSRVEVRLTAGSLKDATSDASALTTGIVADGRLPPRLRKFEMQIGAATGNLNSIVEAGHYWVAGGVLNTPVAGINGWVLADVVHADLQLQEFQQYNSANRWRRQKTADGQWQPWVQLFSIKPDEIPIGVITDFAGATAKLPAGWLFCAGQALTIGVAGSAYYALYQVIGAAFNTYAAGPGVPSAITTPAGQFRLPDLRGRVSAGLDTMAGLASANRLTNPTASTTGGINGDVLGGVGGLETHKLTDAQLANHAHSLVSLTAKTKTGSGEHQHNYLMLGGAAAPGYQFGNSQGLVNRVTAAAEGDHQHALQGDTATFGNDTPHNNVQPTIILNKIIRYQ